MRRATHGGGVVYRMTEEGPRYLLVEASGETGRWVLPKGHIEEGESVERTAEREVAEEAGVRARPVRAVGKDRFRKNGRKVRVDHFLMEYLGTAPATENRRVRWCGFEEARKELGDEGLQKVLRSADLVLKRRVKASWRRRVFWMGAALAGAGAALAWILARS